MTKGGFNTLNGVCNLHWIDKENMNVIHHIWLIDKTFVCHNQTKMKSLQHNFFIHIFLEQSLIKNTWLRFSWVFRPRQNGTLMCICMKMREKLHYSRLETALIGLWDILQRTIVVAWNNPIKFGLVLIFHQIIKSACDQLQSFYFCI